MLFFTYGEQFINVFGFNFARVRVHVAQEHQEEVVRHIVVELNNASIFFSEIMRKLSFEV